MFGATFFVEPASKATTQQIQCETDSNIEHGLISNYVNDHNEENQENEANSEEYEQAQYIVFGYYRNIDISNDYIIPLDVINLLLSYYYLHVHHIFISDNDETMTFEVKPHDTVWDIKSKIVKTKQLDIRIIKSLMLTYNNKELKRDANTLLAYNIKDGDTIKVSESKYIYIKIQTPYSWQTVEKVDPHRTIDYYGSNWDPHTIGGKVYKISDPDSSGWVRWYNRVELMGNKTFSEQGVENGDTLYFQSVHSKSYH